MRRRVSVPSSDVPFLTDKAIEQETLVLLAEYSEQCRPITAPPIPIDEIIELHLKLTFELQDLRQLFHTADVHGAIWINEGRLAVDQCLDPSGNPRKLGRYRFTLGHETGHWRLHRTHYLKNEAQRSLFDKQSGKPAYICRSNQKPRVEMQADRFSAFLLMPRDFVLRAWEQHRGNLDPVTLDDLRRQESEILAAEVLRRGRLGTDRESIDNTLLEWCGLPLAGLFEVSPEAMRIRLESLGLLVRKKEKMLFE
jgi:hypothetical protein